MNILNNEAFEDVCKELVEENQILKMWHWYEFNQGQIASKVISNKLNYKLKEDIKEIRISLYKKIHNTK